MEHKIRIYSARMDTKYGTDVAFIVDDPACPRDTEDIIGKLMNNLNYIENEDDDCDYTGHCDGTGAYFTFDGCEDFEIPESIVQRILKGE